MYTIIVADDEEQIRKGIIKKVDWKSVGFEVIGEAENGADALELVEKLEPDLLLTDIRMPFLSGIELARQIREVRPTVQIAFLSGFDDFTYAQQAIQYNIVSYMLKPISAKELEAELWKIKTTMDEKFAEFAMNNSSHQKVETSEFLMPLLLDSFIQGKVSNRIHIENAVSCGFLKSAESDHNFEYVILVTVLEDENGNNITNRALVNAVDMILKKYVRYSSCYLQGRIVSVVAATHSGLNKYLHILVEEIVQSVERILKHRCQIGVSRMMNDLSECREGYLESMNAISYSDAGESRVYFISDEEKNEAFSQEQIQGIVDNIESLLRGGSSKDLEEYIRSLEESLRIGKNSLILISLLISQIVAAVYRVLYAVAGDSGVQKIQNEFPLEELQNFDRVTESFIKVSKMCSKAKNMILTQRKRSSEVICEKALDIIDSRYTEQELSIVIISEEIGVTPNYLSALIKKSTGRTVVELLTYKRIEKAKELLCTTSMKIKEITEACGYRDQYYFSHCFKKITGMSPNVCRREYEQQGKE